MLGAHATIFIFPPRRRPTVCTAKYVSRLLSSTRRALFFLSLLAASSRTACAACTGVAEWKEKKIDDNNDEEGSLIPFSSSLLLHIFLPYIIMPVGLISTAGHLCYFIQIYRCAHARILAVRPDYRAALIITCSIFFSRLYIGIWWFPLCFRRNEALLVFFFHLGIVLELRLATALCVWDRLFSVNVQRAIIAVIVMCIKPDTLILTSIALQNWMFFYCNLIPCNEFINGSINLDSRYGSALCLRHLLLQHNFIGTIIVYLSKKTFCSHNKMRVVSITIILNNKFQLNYDVHSTEHLQCIHERIHRMHGFISKLVLNFFF